LQSRYQCEQCDDKAMHISEMPSLDAVVNAEMLEPNQAKLQYDT